MLRPDDRTVAVELLRPPEGYHLDFAALTTFSLDLEALLALPLAVLAHSDGGVDELLGDPLLLLEALRRAGDRVHVFVDVGRIAIPRVPRALYAMLESSVHPVRAPHGGAFHPKVWVARFESEGQPPLLRVAVLSRNLTFDRSWDVALATEGSPAGKRRVAASRPLGELLRVLPQLATVPLPEPVAASLLALAEQAERTSFPAPDGFDDPVTFHLLGASGARRRPWKPQAGGSRVLAIAPFVNKTALQAVAEMSGGEHALVARQEELDEVSPEVLADWDPILVLEDAAVDEPEDETSTRPSGLHAKVIAIEHGWDVTWYVGSANLTAAAFTGTNVEMMVSVSGRKGRKSGQSGQGIDRFLESGFLGLCKRYQGGREQPRALEVAEARSRLEQARDLLATATLRVVCAPAEQDWTWTLEGELTLPEDVGITVWPVTLPEEHARGLELPSRWSLPTPRLTAFVALCLRVPVPGVDDIRMTLKVPARGMPEGRISQILRTLIDSPERLLRFLRALLGGLDGMVDWARAEGDGSEAGPWKSWLGGETLLEDLVRVASRQPSRLVPVRRLIEDLRSTEQGRTIVPDELLAIWMAVEAALDQGVSS
ncbi:MAG: phospholipase D family protein [Nannocystaceae bacterium]